jgi:spore coat protein U-like protein
MEGPGRQPLAYLLFADPGHTIPWGDGQAIGPPRGGRAEGGKPARLTVHGLVPPQPGTPPGSYADSLQVTLTF